MTHCCRTLTVVLTLALAGCGGGGGGSSGGHGGSSNQPPVAIADLYSSPEDVILNVASPLGPLWNDYDPDHDILTPTLATQAAHGTAAVNADGSFTYAPVPDFVGTDTFTYTVSDGTFTTAETAVEITVTPVNDPPVAVDDVLMLDEDVFLIVAAPGLLANDSDIDSETLTTEYVTLPQHGSLGPNSNGSLTYLPDADYHGPDSYTYRVRDGALYSAPATVSITIKAVNDAPVAYARHFPADGAGKVNAAAPGVLTDAIDADGDVVTATLVTPPSHGALTLNANGSFSYTATGGYMGVDSFSWKAGDGATFSTVQTATIGVGITDPGDAYAISGEGDVVVLRAGGGPPLPLPGFPAGGASELAVNPARTLLFTTHGTNGGILIRKHDLVLHTTTDLATIPAYVVGLDFDPADGQGWLYMTEFSVGAADHAGDVWRVHPVTGAVEKLAVTSGIDEIAIGTVVGKDTAGAGTAVYIIPYHIFGAFPNWLFKRVGNTAVPCVKTPTGIDGFGLCHVGGAVTDAQGRLYMIGMWDNKVYRWTDTNGDGLFLEQGTTPEVFATLPISDGELEFQTCGLAIAKDGSLLVSVRSLTGDPMPGEGTYWVKDANPAVNAPDGTPAEIVMLRNAAHAASVASDLMNVIAAPR